MVLCSAVGAEYTVAMRHHGRRWYVTAHEELGGVAGLTCLVACHARVVGGVLWPYVRNLETGGERVVVLADLQVRGGREIFAVTEPPEGHGRVTYLHVTGHSGPHARDQRPEVKGLDGGWHCKRSLNGSAMAGKSFYGIITVDTEGGRVRGRGSGRTRPARVVPGVVRSKSLDHQRQYELS